MMIAVFFSMFSVVTSQGNCSSVACYNDEREALVSFDLGTILSSSSLSPDELRVQSLMMSLRSELLQKYFDPPLAQRNWRDIELMARGTDLYQLFKTFPKGGALHVHDIATISVAMQATYDPDCFVDWRNESATFGYFRFNATDGWTNVVSARKNSSDPTAFDAALAAQLSFVTPDLTVNETMMWRYFDGQLSKLNSLTSGKASLAEKIYLESLQALVDEGVTHLELRVFLADVPMFTRVFNEFVEKTNSTLTIRFISESLRHDSNDAVLQAMKNTLVAMQNDSAIVGFDLVDEEDGCCSLRTFEEQFMAVRNFSLSKVIYYSIVSLFVLLILRNIYL